MSIALRFPPPPFLEVDPPEGEKAVSVAEKKAERRNRKGRTRPHGSVSAGGAAGNAQPRGSAALRGRGGPPAHADPGSAVTSPMGVAAAESAAARTNPRGGPGGPPSAVRNPRRREERASGSIPRAAAAVRRRESGGTLLPEGCAEAVSLEEGRGPAGPRRSGRSSPTPRDAPPPPHASVPPAEGAAASPPGATCRIRGTPARRSRKPRFDQPGCR